MSSKSEWKSTKAHQRPRFKFWNFRLPWLCDYNLCIEEKHPYQWPGSPTHTSHTTHSTTHPKTRSWWHTSHATHSHATAHPHATFATCPFDALQHWSTLLVAGVIWFKVLNEKKVESFVSFDIETRLHPCHLCHRVHQLVACHPLVFTVAGHGCNWS